MATRKFELPGIQDLTKEQELVRALPKQGQHLIVGGPGTGKSVMALIRSRRLEQDRDHYIFLVYNHLLHRASQHLFGKRLSGKTWERWFRALFRKTFGHSIPKLTPQPKTRYRPIDWDTVLKTVKDQPEPEDLTKPFLVIDEGQDMPPEFYEVLIELGFEDFFVACDQNQQIMENNSSRKDIEIFLGLDPSEVIELSYNHRNSYPVAKLAREFYTDDPASPPPDLPASSRANTPTLYIYESSPDGPANVAKRILQWVDRQPSRLVGVLAPHNRVRELYLNAFSSAATNMSLENELPPIETFHSQYRPEVSFDQGGILVINAQACKGLEFDDVMLVDIDEHYVPSNDLDMARKLFYVMVSRARENVFMFQRKGRPSAIEKVLPTDTSILKRRNL